MSQVGSLLPSLGEMDRMQQMRIRMIEEGIEEFERAKKRFTRNATKEICVSILKSYGAMTVTLSFLTRFEQHRMQGLDQWWYNVGVCRV